MLRKTLVYGFCSLIFMGLTPMIIQSNVVKKMTITSSAFKAGEMIPSKYTCDGENISPKISWKDTPVKTVTLALICDDPDAPRGDWVHWVVFNIPPFVNEIAEAIPAKADLYSGMLHGKNDFGKFGYGGPCPPSGIHRYYFKLFALDIGLPLSAGATKAELLKAIEGHILAKTELIGKYQRKR